MRTKNSFINIIIGCLSYGIIMIGSFVTRKLFIDALGLEVYGIEGAFTNAVGLLAIVELGLGVSIVYKLYRPIAQKNWETVSVVLCFLRRFYSVVAVVVFSLGALSSYFIVMPIKENFSKIWLIEIFMLYVIDVVSSYLYSHKRSMFIADQKNYVNNLIHVVVQVVLFILQIIVLKIFASFEAFLICKIVCRLTENLIVSYRFNRRYGFINLKTKSRMPEIEKKDLFKNMKALLCHKISSFAATSVSALIITYIVGAKGNGVYSNYALIVMALTSVTNEIFNGILASFGNFLNTESRIKVYKKFNLIYFLNFLIYSFIISSFFCLVSPFMVLWNGEKSVFDLITTISITMYLFIYGIRQSITMVKCVAGIYDPDKYLAIVGTIITSLSSWVLAYPFGVAGVMVGNVIGMMSITYWAQPYLVYNEVFHKSVKPYHLKFIMYTALTSVYAFISYMACGFIKNNTNILRSVSGVLEKIKIPADSSICISEIIINLVVCVVVPNLINVLIFFKTEEFKELRAVGKSFLRKIKK